MCGGRRGGPAAVAPSFGEVVNLLTLDLLAESQREQHAAFPIAKGRQTGQMQHHQPQHELQGTGCLLLAASVQIRCPRWSALVNKNN